MQTIVLYTVELVKDVDDEQYAAIITTHSEGENVVETVHVPNEFVEQIPHYMSMLQMMR